MKAPGYLELLRTNVPLRNLWLGQVVSFLGDWFTTIALLTIVMELTDSVQALSLVLVCRMLPIFLVTPIAGPLVDRFDRRKLMLMTDFARAALPLGLVLAHHLGSLSLLLGVLVVKVGFSGIFIPARTAAIPQLTQRHEIPAAMALSGGTWSIMLAAGAAVGGLTTEYLGTDATLLLDGGTYLLSAFFIARLPALPPERTPGQPRAGFVDGLRYLRRRPYLCGVMSLKSGMSLSAGVVAMIPIYGTDVDPLRSGALYVGLLYTFRGLGSVGGTLGMRRFSGDSPAALRSWIVAGFLLATAAYSGLAFAPDFVWAAACFALGAFGTGMIWVFASTLGQLASDGAFRGRVFSLEFAGLTLTFSAASWISGALVDWTRWTYVDVVFASGLTLLLPAAAWVVLLAVTRPEGDGRVALLPSGATEAP